MGAGPVGCAICDERTYCTGMVAIASQADTVLLLVTPVAAENALTPRKTAAARTGARRSARSMQDGGGYVITQLSSALIRPAKFCAA